MELVKFIPPDFRLEMAQEAVEKMGIRPLAREIGVNPKSVYKYKEGEAHPGNDVMEKILAVLKKEDPDLLEEHLQSLREQFMEAFDSSMGSEKLLEDVEEGFESEESESESEGVDSESTGEEGVSSEPTKEVSLETIWEQMDVSTPFNQMKIEKILDALSGESELQVSEIEEMTGVSVDAIEDYLEPLETQDFVNQPEPGKFKLKVELVEGG